MTLVYVGQKAGGDEVPGHQMCLTTRREDIAEGKTGVKTM
jgi:hypothetical protein